MFWGLTLESGKRYAQKVESSFHVSMAALDLKSAGSDSNDSVSVILTVDKNDYLLCNLSKQKFQQQALDLNFQTGDTIAFMTKGKGIVHLTGYLVLEDDFSQFPSDMEEEEESEDEEVDIPAAIKKELMKDAKKRKGEQEVKVTAKKAKVGGKAVAKLEDSDEEDDSDDEEEEDVGSFVDKFAGEGDSEEESGEEEEDDEDEEGDEEEGEEEEESEEDESEEEEEEVSPPPKQKQKQQQTPAKTPVMNGNSNQKDSGKKNKKEKGPETPKAQTPKGQQQQQQKTPQQQQQKTPQQQQQKTPQQQKSPAGGQQKLPGGLIIEDTIQGNGPVAKPGRTACVYYVGRLKHNNKQFDATQSGQGFKFRLGRGEVIKGWDVGVQGMKVGGKRKIICPPQMGYGARGSPPTIPPNSYLVFEVELKSVS